MIFRAGAPRGLVTASLLAHDPKTPLVFPIRPIGAHFTYFRNVNWGGYYLSTVPDDFSRDIIAWKLGSAMGASDVTQALDEAIAFTGVDQVPVKHRPRLLSDNGSAYLSSEIQDYLLNTRSAIPGVQRVFEAFYTLLIGFIHSQLLQHVRGKFSQWKIHGKATRRTYMP